MRSTHVNGVEGDQYSSDDIIAGNAEAPDRNYAQAEDYVEKYPEGDKVTVYYNPSDPDESALEPELKAAHWGGTIFGFISIVIGLILTGFGYLLHKTFLGELFFKQK